MLSNLMAYFLLFGSLNIIGIFGQFEASGGFVEQNGFSFGNQGMPEDLSLNNDMYSNFGHTDAPSEIDSSQLRPFPGYCTFTIPTNTVANELCGAVVFSSNVYGLSTSDPFETLVRQSLRGNYPFKTYRFTNSQNIRSQEYQFSFLSWHNIQEEPPKYSCKLESGCVSTPTPAQGSTYYNAAPPSVFDDKTAINEFTGSCTFDIKYTLKKEEFIAAVVFEEDVYGFEAQPGFDVLVEQSARRGFHHSKVFRLTNKGQIEPSTLEVSFLSWYTIGTPIPKFICKLETECTTPGEVHKYGFP